MIIKGKNRLPALLVALSLLGSACATGGSAVKIEDQGISRIEEDESSGVRMAEEDEIEDESADLQSRTMPPSKGEVIDIIKGDELVLSNGWNIRLLNIDTPTADYGKRTGEFYGKKALDYIKQRLLGKKVRLEYEVKVVDDYGRGLAYVFDDKGMINVGLLEEGLALAVCFPPNVSRCDEFSTIADKAMTARKGLWDFDVTKWQKKGKAKNVVEGVVVAEVLDGDTIKLQDGTYVRYIGIDAPESEAVWRAKAYGNEAYRLNRSLVEGKVVTLEYDTEYTDPRGRELAYVWVGGKMVNKELVGAGVAWVAVFPPNVRHIRELFEAQAEAAESGKGIWGSE